MKLKIATILSFFITNLFSQFPGPVGTIGTTAMHADSSVFIAWAKVCNVIRGYQDISTPTLGFTTVGDSSLVIGKADGSIVSLGDGGIAIVTFSTPIANGPGYDFAIFENAFNDSFLELAFVEVSSDGTNYFRFPAICNLPTTPQYTNDAVIDATKINNLAGKYRVLSGTPFDLQELSGITQLDIYSITHLKIIDAVGSINTLFATYDTNNNVINDPWPTPFPSSGFDLDAVGVINQSAVGLKEFNKNDFSKIYPNPNNGLLNIEFKMINNQRSRIKITNTLGQIMLEESSNIQHSIINIQHFPSGVYFVHVESENEKSTLKLIKD